MKRIITILLALCLLLAAGCGEVSAPVSGTLEPAAETVSPAPEKELSAESGSELLTRAAVVYNGADNDGSWRDVFSRLDQSLLLCFEVEAVDAARGFDAAGYDLLYLDESLLTLNDAESFKAAVEAFTEAGGGVFLTNGFYAFFDADFIGARDFVKVEGYPENLGYPELGDDLGEAQELICDFVSLYAGYPDHELTREYDYGWAVTPSTSTALVTLGDAALYTVNGYGDGLVFFTNPLLPNAFSISGFELESRSDAQTTMYNTTVSCNQLIENWFASYMAKREYGFAAERVFGSFGRTDMAWELHFEEITGFANYSGILFGELCKRYDQIPSYTLVRNTYKWFFKAESVTYLLGADGGFEAEHYENAYSSGAHVAAGDRWLTLAELEDAGSYYTENSPYSERAYPALADLNGDGLADIVCGSSDGRFHYYEGQGFDGKLRVSEGETLKGPGGGEIFVQGYSAPALCDVDGDGATDIVTGSTDGKLYWFSGGADMRFEYEGLLCELVMPGRSMPAVGDLDGDGCLDLVVGCDAGVLAVGYGETETGLAVSDFETFTPPGDIGSWCAPAVFDMGGDGAGADIAVGTKNGYIARLLRSEDGGFEFGGYLSAGQMNYLGNDNIKLSSNCVPVFCDINGDGEADLIAGSLEYGMAYPIDSEFFPYRDELGEALDYITDNGFYLGLHLYTHAYATGEWEAQELGYHRAAMEEEYGIDLSGAVGMNNHTWYSSSYSPAQSLLSAWDAGLLWNSGFRPSRSTVAFPEDSETNVIALPFFLVSEGERTILVQNCSTLLDGEAWWAELSAKYGMPVCLYYHCDFTYRDEADALINLQTAENFRTSHGYNFVGEDQMMLATAAAYNLRLSAVSDGEGWTLTPSAVSGDFPLYDEAYQSSCGVRIDFADGVDAAEWAVDAEVWSRDGDDIRASASSPIRLYRSDAPEETHLTAVNIAADITLTDTGALVEFLDGGMMQLTVSGPARTDCEGWEARETDGGVTFTKYGGAETVAVIYD